MQRKTIRRNETKLLYQESAFKANKFKHQKTAVNEPSKIKRLVMRTLTYRKPYEKKNLNEKKNWKNWQMTEHDW